VPCAQAQQDYEASIELVGNMSRNRSNKNGKWGKTDEAVIEHANPGDVIYLPAHAMMIIWAGDREQNRATETA